MADLVDVNRNLIDGGGGHDTQSEVSCTVNKMCISQLHVKQKINNLYHYKHASRGARTAVEPAS